MSCGPRSPGRSDGERDGVMERIEQSLACRFLPVWALVVLMSSVTAGCAPREGHVATEGSSISSEPTAEIPPSRTDSGSEGGDLVILLAEASAMASTCHITWPEYQMPLFALWPDGCVLVLEKGGSGAGAPVYLEAQLDRQQIDTLRGWIEDADVSSLADFYPQPQTGDTRIMISDATELRLRVRDGRARADVTFALGYPVDDMRLPARLDTFDKQLRTYRPPNAHTFIHDSIEVVVRELARTGVKNRYHPLPAEFSLDGMTEIFGSVEEVHYSTTFRGAAAARIAARINAGEWLYQDDRRSYRIVYRPLLDWPEP